MTKRRIFSHNRESGDEVDSIATNLLEELLLPNGWERTKWSWIWQLISNPEIRISLSIQAPSEVEILIYAGIYEPTGSGRSRHYLGDLVVSLADETCHEKIVAWVEEMLELAEPSE